MTIKSRTTFYIILAILLVWFLYIERAILTPFILAGIFAYIFNPIVNFASHKIKLPRIVTIIIIYLVIISSMVIFSIFLTRRIIEESFEFKNYFSSLIDTTKNQLAYLPDWIRPAAEEGLSSLEKSKVFSPASLFTVFPQAISRIISFFIFLFSGFYFLKEGRNFIDKILLLVPNKHRIEVEIILRKINSVFGGYLRGQLFLVFLVSTMLFVALSVLGVRFALIIAIFSGFAEIVPIIGPITAGAIASIIVFVTGASNFNLAPISAALIVALIYFVIRQFQDYFINPLVMGKITNLHPLIVLFAVLAGGHLWGWLGLILAVPIAATIRILLEFTLDKVDKEKIKTI